MHEVGATIPEAPSGLAICLQSLMADGRAVVSPAPAGPSIDDALPLLAQLDTAARAELALELPALSLETALWAAQLFHQLCRFVVCRDLPAEQIAAACAVPCPPGPGPETAWSADLLLRHLPGLFRLARHLSNADPLVREMTRIAAVWPLSSVGIPGLTNLQIDSLCEHPGLLRLYTDRVLAAGEVSRLGDPRIDDALRASIGVHHDLAPALASRLFQIQP